MTKIPVTVLTGFLGSGKTTLLNRILTEDHGQRIAVIENEFGEIGIDQALVIDAEEEIFEMNNGCICCTVRGDLIRILGNLVKRRSRFDRVIVETTGLADPGPVAQTFFVDEDVREHFVLDGIVTLVDAKHVALHLDDSAECREQIAFADVLVLNKTDLVSAAEVDALAARLARTNALARVLRAEHAAVPIAAVLDVGGFDLDRALATKPDFLEPEYPFEWAGTLALEAGAHELVVHDGPDPRMKVAVLPLEAGELAHDRAAADRALAVFTAPPRPCPPGAALDVGDGAPGAELDVGDGAARADELDVGDGAPRANELDVGDGAPRANELDLTARGPKRFPLAIATAGRYGLYTEHLPAEHDLVLRRGAAVVAPLASGTFAGHTHDAEVGSVGIHLDGEVDRQRLDAWLRALLRDHGADIFRMKGILAIAGSEQRFVFQGVHMLFDSRADQLWGSGPRASDLVFIGRNLDRAALTAGFLRCRA